MKKKKKEEFMEIQKGRNNQCYKTFAVATLIGHSKTSTKRSKIINSGKVAESWSV